MKNLNLNKIPYSITNSKFITKIYFDWIYKKIIEVGNLDRDIIAIDYGCGFGHLKKLNIRLKNKSNIINYDIVKELSEISNIFDVKFDLIIFCQSCYLMEEEEIHTLLDKIKKFNYETELIFVISKQNIINKLLSIMTFNFKFYKNVKTKPKTEMSIIDYHCNLIQKKNLLLSYLIKAKFKK
tara:strand:- start:1030 stop:1575 length:546 start_codon:yes stop_codon:yes gene_type:complete